MSLDGPYDPGNIFAKIVRGEAPRILVHEDDDVLAFMDVFPQADGHVLVVPKASCARNILEMDAATLQKMIVAVQRIASAIRAALQPDGILVAQLNGMAAGQTVDHFHFHIIPCWSGQPIRGEGIREKADIDELLALATKIAALRR